MTCCLQRKMRSETPGKYHGENDLQSIRNDIRDDAPAESCSETDRVVASCIYEDEPFGTDRVADEKPCSHRKGQYRDRSAVLVLDEPHDERGEYEAEDVSARRSDKMAYSAGES